MSNVPVVTAPAAKVKEHKLSLKEKVSYGFGDFGNGFMFDLGQIYLLKFSQMSQAFRRCSPAVFFGQQAVCGFD